MLTEQDLIAYLENTLSPTDRQRVEAELERDPQQRRQFIRQRQLDAALRASLGESGSHERVKQSVLAVIRGETEEAIKQQVLADTSFTSRPLSILHFLSSIFRRPAWTFTAAAACIAIFLGVWFVTRPAPLALAIETPTQVALASGMVTPKPGDTIRASDTTSATVTFADGTTLHLEPGTEIRLEAVANPPRAGGKQFKLISGALSADVAKQPAGLPLLIQTPHALVTVVGTEFDLTVGTNQTQLEVEHGLVQFSGIGSTNPLAVAAGELAVATEGSPQVQRLARNPYFWPFSSDSPWNTPIGSGAQFAPVPGKPFLADGPLVRAMRGRHPFFGRPTDTLRRVWVGGEVRADVRLSENALPPTGLIEPVVLMQRTQRYALELVDVQVRPDGDLEAADIERTDLAGSGLSPAAIPAKPFGLSNLGGLIRMGELSGGIRHALSARVNRERLGGRNSFQKPSTVWPAAGSDAASGEFLNVGSLLAIPPGVDIRALAGNSGPGYELARAMQDYGVYISGYGNAAFALVRGEAELIPADEDKILNQLVPLLQVVANNTEATPGGGGTPRREAAPALPSASK
ncbi:MAG: hypothetical protein EXS35_16070 [Pedosphaera sp.]|nr:hypothetical protein [Pedosphaera sp.]